MKREGLVKPIRRDGLKKNRSLRLSTPLHLRKDVTKQIPHRLAVDIGGRLAN